MHLLSNNALSQINIPKSNTALVDESTPIKPNTNLCEQKDLTLEIVDAKHRLWSQVTEHVARRYQQTYQAELQVFMPTYFTYMQQDTIKSLCGIRVASEETLFLERYLDEPAEVLLSRHFTQPIERHQLIEFGHLASFTQGSSPWQFLMMAETLITQGFSECIFTATDPLKALMRRMGLRPHLIAAAKAERIEHAERIWGNYYHKKPHVYAGHLTQGVQVLRSLRNSATAQSAIRG